MMTTIKNINIRTDKEVEIATENIFREFGLNMTTAVNMFLRQAIRENGIPFDRKTCEARGILLCRFSIYNEKAADGESAAFP